MAAHQRLGLIIINNVARSRSDVQRSSLQSTSHPLLHSIISLRLRAGSVPLRSLRHLHKSDLPDIA